MIIGTNGTYLESFTIFHSGRNDGVKIWVFHSTREISRKVTPDIDFTDLVQFVQSKKREKHPLGVLLLVKLQALKLVSAIFLKFIIHLI